MASLTLLTPVPIMAAMKYLTIIRHAKTEPANIGATDFDRELTKRGHKDATLVGQLLSAWEPPIDWLVSSTAARARTTAEIIAAELAYANQPAWRNELYAASPETINRVLIESPPTAHHVALIAHNPGLEDLASGLCVPSPARLSLVLPTAGVAHLSLEIARWDQLRWGCARLEFLFRPKLLRGFQ
jgi:phosphohistidine phosphatase